MPEQVGGELLARQMVNEGVEDLFYIMGGPIIETAGFAADHGIRTIDCRHEQGAAMAAHGYARVKRKPGVCLAASGPATTNLLTGVANAYLDCAPLVALGGAAAYSSFERDDFQEYDQLSMARPVTRWASRVTHNHRMPEFFNLAYRKAQVPKPGPTYLDLPGDTLYNKADDERVWFPPATKPVRQAADPDQVKEAIDLLSQAERPIIISGSGVVWSQAAPELKEFVEATNIPFWTTPQGRGVIPEDHDLCFLGARSMAFKEADVAIVLATRMNFIIGGASPPRFAPDLKVIQVDMDPSEIGHNRPVQVGMVADAKRALVALKAAAAEANLQAPDDWIGRLREADHGRRQEYLDIANDASIKPIHPLRVANEIVTRVDRDAIVCVDGHATLAWARQFIPSFVDGARLNPGPNGCMGIGLPFALGAKVAAPERQVVAFIGDGSFLMNVQEIDTMVRHNLPITMVISNNGGWTAYKNSTPGRVLGFKQNYQDIAVALGGHGELVTEPEDVGPAVERAMASGKPAVVNVHVDEHADPATSSFGGYSAMLTR